MTNKFKRKCFQKLYVSSKQEKEWYRKTTSYLEQRSRHFCQHFMRRTTRQTLLSINLASQQKTTKLYFSSQVRKRFHLSHYAVVCEMINLWIAMFENSAKIYFKTYAWFDLSIKPYFLMVSSLILLRPLRVYILKQLFFSISVNRGFGNIHLAAFAAK